MIFWEQLEIMLYLHTFIISFLCTIELSLGA